MTSDPYPASALAENRQLRLTADQVTSLHADARESKRSLSLAGFWLLALGLFILWGTFTGRVPGSKLQSFAVGTVFAAVGGLLLSPRGVTRGPSAAQAASSSTVLEVVEGTFRREQYDRQPAADLLGSSTNIRGDARYNFYLHVGERRFDVGRPAYEAAPEDGIVRVYVLPSSDRIVNLERIADAPPTPLEVRAAAELNKRFGTIPDSD